MTQMSFCKAAYAGERKQTRCEIFRAEIEQVMPWGRLPSLIERSYPKASNGLPPYSLGTILRTHLLQNWFALSDLATEEALYEIILMRQFAKVSATQDSIPDDTAIMNSATCWSGTNWPRTSWW